MLSRKNLGRETTSRSTGNRKVATFGGIMHRKVTAEDKPPCPARLELLSEAERRNGKADQGWPHAAGIGEDYS
jgi:hypothetical protein